MHLGDYVYEGAPHSRGPRRHQGGELYSLQDYRSRHAQYRRDPQLQAAHARFPFLCTWDDHEVENNFAGTTRPAIGRSLNRMHRPCDDRISSTAPA